MYNDAVVPALRELGVIVNDLYSFVLPNIDTYIKTEDNIHLTEEGSEACAQQIAAFLRQID